MVEALGVALISVGINDTSVVELKGFSVDGNSEGSSGVKEALDFLLVLGLGKDGSGDLNGTLGFVEFAGSISGSVLVVRRLLETSGGLEVGEGVLHETSIATLVLTLVAVNELLLGELDEFLGLDEVESFEVSDGGEGPTASALTLILDGADGSFLSPIVAFGSGLGEGETLTLGFLNVQHVDVQVAVCLSELLGSHVGELVDSNRVGSVAVEGEGLKSGVVALENLESGNGLFDGRVLLVVLDRELLESAEDVALLFVGVHGHHDGSQREC